MLLWIAVGPRGLAGYYGEGGGEQNKQIKLADVAVFTADFQLSRGSESEFSGDYFVGALILFQDKKFNSMQQIDCTISGLLNSQDTNLPRDDRDVAQIAESYLPGGGSDLDRDQRRAYLHHFYK